MFPENVEPLITEEQLRQRVAELGAQLTEDYRGKELVVVGVLKGSFPFVADLVRRIELPLRVDFLGLSSYGSGTESTGVVKITSDLTCPISGKHVLVVEDIVDTGLTMHYLLENLATRQPASVRVCALLAKPSRLRAPVEIAYRGFTIPDAFVVGYGLDHDERYRNLPFLGALKLP